jgi:hypothetical protein
MSQSSTFSNAIKDLYFGVDIKNSSDSLIDTLMAVTSLHHNDTVVKQSNLNVYLLLKTDKEAWSYRHVFTFTKSPLQNFKISSGYIEVLIGKAPGIEKVLDIHWKAEFDNKADAEKFYNKLKEIFAPLSTKQKTEYDKDVGYISQYSTQNENEQGLRDISFVFGKFKKTGKYSISLSLMNEFMNE